MSMDPIRGVYETVDAAELILDHEFIEICHRAGLSVVAEGVENERQLEFLRDNACDDAQGFE